MSDSIFGRLFDEIRRGLYEELRPRMQAAMMAAFDEAWDAAMQGLAQPRTATPGAVVPSASADRPALHRPKPPSNVGSRAAWGTTKQVIQRAFTSPDYKGTRLRIFLSRLSGGISDGTLCVLRGLAMARNRVQFQKGLSEAAFERQYTTEEQCRAAIVAWRWPNGFECHGCGGRQHSVVMTYHLYQCTACRRQSSTIAGTIFASSHLPLCTWFRAIYHLTRSKQSITSIELGRRLGVTQTIAWKLQHKLEQVMLERDAGKRFRGRVALVGAQAAPRAILNLVEWAGQTWRPSHTLRLAAWRGLADMARDLANERC